MLLYIPLAALKHLLKDWALKSSPVEELTSYPSILGGRVKTLHPKVFGGILNRRDNTGDQQQIAQYEIPEIDLVIVDLYPFEATVASGAPAEDIIEKIDIGGISLIRAAAKNYNDVVIVSSRDQYQSLLDLLIQNEGATTLDERKEFARLAFATSSHYDSAIFNYFNQGQFEKARISVNDGQVLRYGENPHQSATFFKFNNTNSDVTLSNANVLQGKALSYNNMLDADAAWKSASDAYHSITHINNKVAVSVVKHLNPCGLAVTDNIMKSLELAWAGDPVSAFGGIICFTGEVDQTIAEWFNKRFVEIIIATGLHARSSGSFSARRKTFAFWKHLLNLKLLVKKLYRSISGGLLIQDEDEGLETEFKNVTQIQFDSSKMNLSKFGITACKHLKSNAIALVTQNTDGSFWLTGAGMGQPNRLDSLRQLTIPRFNLKEGIKIEDSVLISDAFFPFRDSVEAANEFGIKYIVEPGGSIRDEEVITACNEFGIAMVFTGVRHFKH